MKTIVLQLTLAADVPDHEVALSAFRQINAPVTSIVVLREDGFGRLVPDDGTRVQR